MDNASSIFKKTTFWSNSKNPVLKIPTTLKVSCFGRLPNGVEINADDIKLIESPTLKFKLNASSVPINMLFEPKFPRFPVDKYFLKNSVVFFSFLLRCRQFYISNSRYDLLNIDISSYTLFLYGLYLPLGLYFILRFLPLTQISFNYLNILLLLGSIITFIFEIIFY